MAKGCAATDPAEIDNLLLEFRDAVHEHIEQRRAEAKKLEEPRCQSELGCAKRR